MPGTPRSWACTIGVDAHEYDHLGATIECEVYVDPKERLRQVIGGVKNPDGRRCHGPVDEVEWIQPRWYHRLRERLTSWEFEPVPQEEQIRRVTEELETWVEEMRRVQERHTDGLRITHVNGEPVEPGETPEVEVTLGDEDG